jgi:HSP20 family protein
MTVELDCLLGKLAQGRLNMHMFSSDMSCTLSIFNRLDSKNNSAHLLHLPKSVSRFVCFISSLGGGSTMSNKLSTSFTKALRPFRDPITSLQHEIDDLFGRLQSGWNGGETMLPSIDLSETDTELQVRVDVPGFKADQIELEVVNNNLRIKGEYKEEKEEKDKTFHRLERHVGSFTRTIALPSPVIENKVNAECEDGILTVTLPKSEVAKTQRIKVKAK